MANNFWNRSSLIYTRLIILTHLLFSYNAFNGWWYSILGTIIILLLARRGWPEDWLKWIGLKISPKVALLSLLLLLLVAIGSYQIINSIAIDNMIAIKFVGLLIFIHIIGYTLNEEILIGAILLTYLKKRYPYLKKYLISVLVAVAFSILHYVFYRWIFQDKGILTIASLFSLVALGVIRNNLILGTGHIGYSWAIHAGWVAAMFGLTHVNSINTLDVTESDRFNLYLGSGVTMLILLIVMIVSFWFLKGRRVNELTTISIKRSQGDMIGGE